ncbi:MAG TPA: MFS transporter [Nocardioides sp.]|jgi:EmrB/QacA subfamily drug resistance transporter|nr:MFS transporter [Nocardioides sp.]
MSHHAHRTVVQPTAADTHGTADHTHVGHAGHGHGHGTSHGHGHGTSHGDHGPDVRRPWTTLAVMLMAQFMVILDVSVVNVALPSIGRSMSFSSGDYQWVVSAYVLLSGGLLLFGGRLADLFERRTVFLSGLAVFTTASLVSATASSAATLIVSRAAQGAGAALLTPAALSIIVTTYAGRQRATALAVWGTIGSMGIAAGVLVGGLLTSSFGWRSVFFVNVPIGLVAAALTLHKVSRGAARPGARSVDPVGAAALVSGLLALVYALESAGSHGWTSPRFVLGSTVSVVVLTAFWSIERRVPAPLVPARTWRIQSLTSATAVMAAITAAIVGIIFVSSLFLQQVLGSSPVVTGLEFLPLAATITLGAAAASHVLGHIGPKAVIVVGLLIVALGSTLLANMDSDPGYLTDVLPGFLVVGLGTGLLFVAISIVAMDGIDHAHSGLASGVMMTGHEVGAALGVAALTAVAGDLTTQAGLVAAYPRVFTAVAVAMVVVSALAAIALPRVQVSVSAGGPGHGHGLH